MRPTRDNARSGGRHRQGAPYIPWTRTRWDVRQQADAAGLNLIEPRWLVIYRPWARSFYAVPVWPLPGEDEVEATTIVGLQARMRQAEASSPTVDHVEPRSGEHGCHRTGPA